MSTWGFAAIADAVADRLETSLRLQPTTVPTPFAAASGAWKGAPVRLSTRAWRGEGLASFRVVTLEGAGLEIANLLAVPAPGHAGIVFGADLVSARPDMALVVADLSPLAGSPSAPAAANALPPWAEAVFSNDPLVVRLTPDAADAAERPLHRLAARFCAAPPAGLPADVHRNGVERYMRAHRSDDRTKTMLAHMFGAAWTEAFIDRILYPVPVPTGLSSEDDAA